MDHTMSIDFIKDQNLKDTIHHEISHNNYQRTPNKVTQANYLYQDHLKAY